MTAEASPQLIARRVRYAELRPCTTAFIDARTPGSDRKENFTIIGPGVAENPDQHVHIREPHGFNIGGARQPPRCVNSQHFHETAEVFLVHSGTWAFRTGEHAEEGEVILEPGDVISIPTYIFRGFENVGETSGFLYAVLGGDDPGRVVWAPDVLTRAAGHGLVLTESGRLIDTLSGGQPPSDDPPVRPEPRDRLAAVVRHADSAELERCVVRAAADRPEIAAAPGVRETGVIGPADPATGAPAAPLGWDHGFVCRWVELQPHASTARSCLDGSEVLFVHEGSIEVIVDDERLPLGPGDTFTVPRGSARSLEAGSGGARVFVTRRVADSPNGAR